MPQNDLADIITLIGAIQRGSLWNSHDIALKTEELLEKLVSQSEWNNAKELMNLIKLRIQRVREDLPHESTCVNVLTHVLKVVREEYETGSKSKAEGESLHQLVLAKTDGALNYSSSLPILKSALLEHLSEYKVELETSKDNIATQASEHIHANEIILTCGYSSTVEKFLISAAKSRKFQVIVAEAAPKCHGHKLAANLANNNIQTTVIADGAIFAVMSRVNKVIIGTHTVMANGGLRATSGAHGLALCAKHFSVPVMVLVHLYKLSPFHYSSPEHEFFNVNGSPAEVLPCSAGSILNQVEVLNPLYDYVPPDLVTLFITHQGGNAPSYTYRLLKELYHPDDCDN